MHTLLASLILALIGWSSSAFAAGTIAPGGGSIGGSITVQEEDGSPSATPSTIKFTNGTVTDNGDGSVSVTTGGGDLSSTDIDTSAELGTILGDETGSGVVVFGTAPTISSAVLSTKVNLPRVTAFPGTPSAGDTVIVTDDSSAGACDSDAGAVTSLCQYNGSAWVPLGDGGAAEADTRQTVFDRGKTVTNATSFANAERTGDGSNNGWARYWDASEGGQDNCFVAGVENDCNYSRKLNAGKTFSFKDRNGDAIFTVTEAAGSGALTNVTLDAAATGNTITLSSKWNIPVVGCSGTTGVLLVNTNATLAPTATCTAGSTNTTLIQGYADFPDSDGDYSFQPDPVRLPSDWTGAVDAWIDWKAAATSGDVVWQIATMCTSDAEIEDVAWNTADAFTADTAKGTTLQLNNASKTSITMTNCAAGDLLHVKFLRNRTHASDTITGVVSFKHAEITFWRAH